MGGVTPIGKFPHKDFTYVLMGGGKGICEKIPGTGIFFQKKIPVPGTFIKKKKIPVPGRRSGASA